MPGPQGSSFPTQADPRAGARQRLRALGWFFFSLLYGVFAQQVSSRSASLLAPPGFYALTARLLLVLFLLVGFSAMGTLAQGRRLPGEAVGFPRRPGSGAEWLLGLKLGWGGMVACVLPLALFGGMVVTANPANLSTVESVVLDGVVLLLAALGDELLFRGYPFQQLIAVTGPGLAAVLMALLSALGASGSRLSSLSGTLNGILLALLLAVAYLRTRALWVSWGLHFAWLASMTVLFGLPASGLTQFAPAVSTYTTGPAWLTGGGYGPEGSAFATVVLLVLFVLLSRTTRDLRHRWGHPVIVGAGIPVDIDALQQREHERGMGPSGRPGDPPLVQILPAESPRNSSGTP